MSQQALQDIMESVKDQPYEDVLSMMLLRSMQQARYSEYNHGTMSGSGVLYAFHQSDSPLSRPFGSPDGAGLWQSRK